MKRLWLLVAIVGCDADHDGFVAGDCGPRDVTVYPGAPDVAGDGIDADCDGVDPVPAWAGLWQLQDLSAEYFGTVAIDPGNSSGYLSIAPSGEVTTEIASTVRPELVGFALDVDFVLDGEASSVPDTLDVEVYLKGELRGERTTAAWECSVEGEQLRCRGSLKALDINFDVQSVYERG